jgi:hypothetical protein
MIDKLNLDWEDYYLLEEILKRHPEWLEYTENHPDSDKTFNITIPCPTKGNPPICINNFGDGPIVEFGPPHFDFYNLSRITPITSSHWSDNYNTQCVDAIDVVVDEIITEELIAAYRKGFLGPCGFLNLEEFKHYFEVDKIIKSVSWLGTYNHNYNGEWADPFPDTPIT